MNKAFNPTRQNNRSFRRRSSHPDSQHATEETSRPNATTENRHSHKDTITQINTKIKARFGRFLNKQQVQGIQKSYNEVRTAQLIRNKSKKWSLTLSLWTLEDLK